MNRLIRDESGATFVEFTAVFPLILAFTFGLVDLGLLMFNWAEANRATYAGARFAVVNNPVARNINLTTAPAGTALNGNACFKADGTPSGLCAAVSATTCTGTGPATVACEGSYTPDQAAFAAILAEMQKQYLSKTLDPRQVSIRYEPLPLGYVGRPGGYPMNITVSLKCLRQEVYFVAGLFGWVFPPLPQECQDITDSNGFTLPPFATTLPAEDLKTNAF